MNEQSNQSLALSSVMPSTVRIYINPKIKFIPT